MSSSRAGKGRPTLSIITINKDNSAGVLRTINSFEPFRHFGGIEWIFIDGESKDPSLEVARRFYLPAEVDSSRDFGIYDAMNKGLYKAKGKFIAWINSGDELSPSLDLAALLIDLESRLATLDLILFSVMVVTRHPEATHQLMPANLSLLPRGMICHQGVIFNTSVVRRLGGYNLAFPRCADRDLVLRIYLGGGIMREDPRILSLFHLGGISSRVDLYPENLKVDRKNSLITLRSYAWRLFRYKLGGLLKNCLCFDARNR